MPYLDLPPNMEERVVCSITAAIKYEIPANIMLAVAEKENGPVGKSVRHENGSVDVGAMQFNVNYIRHLEKEYGITANDVAQKGCYPYDLAAWRIRGHIHNDRGDIWTRASNYHSRTPSFNSIYRADLMKKAAKWNTWLSERFPTYDSTAPGAKTVAVATVTGAGTAPEQQRLKVPREALQRSITAAQKAPNLNYRRTYNPAAEKALADMFAPGLMK